jgi:hypothetical protein
MLKTADPALRRFHSVTQSSISEESLSSLWEAEFVKPEAILSFQRCSNQSGNVASMNVASMNALKTAEMPRAALA